MTAKLLLISFEDVTICPEADTSGVWHILHYQRGKVTLTWIPRHHGIAGNKKADACIRHVLVPLVGLSMTTFKALIDTEEYLFL